jgi:glycosyltransferase involved in cell wall biosynthesis
MKIAIVCDWLVTLGGAEQVLHHLIECYPDADIFAVVDFFSDEARANILKNTKVTTSYIQKFPFAKTHYRQYLPWMPLAIEQLDVSQYDLVISSSHAVAKGILTGPDQLHISYVHSPMRYAWDLQHQYLKESGLNKGIKGFFAKRILHKMRLWDQRTANGVDDFVANSEFIARRIWKTYRREAEVIYPPVDLTRFTPTANKEDFYLTASRFVPYKKIDLIVESFAQMPDKKLYVIGDGPDMEKIKAKAAKNIEILGYQPTAVLTDYLQRAKAFVFAAEEDFGILPVEAQACGTPVIAFGKGGCVETVRGLDHSNPTGLFFYEQSVPAICEAVKHFEKNQFNFTTDNCVYNASRFSAEIFQEKFKQLVEDKLNRQKAEIPCASD